MGFKQLSLKACQGHVNDNANRSKVWKDSQKLSWIFKLLKAWAYNCKHVYICIKPSEMKENHQNYLSSWFILNFLEKLFKVYNNIT